MERLCVFGLGEAGSAIASDLVRAGVTVSAFDPAPVPTPEGIARFDDPRDAVRQVEMVLAITAAADAQTALAQALADIPRSAHYVDFSTAEPILKRELGATAADGGLAFTDAALMGTVAGQGVHTPIVASGESAESSARLLRTLGMQVRVVGEEPGRAAAHKLVRSVFVKGFAAVLIESMRAAEAADINTDTWSSIVQQVEAADEPFLARLIEGTEMHARRRHGEMKAALSLLQELGVPATMTEATVESLRRAMEEEDRWHA